MAYPRLPLVLCAAATLVLGVTACGGSSKPTTSRTAASAKSSSAKTSSTTASSSGSGPISAPRSNFAAVVGNGQHYTFSDPTDQQPAACSLLPQASAQALLGGTVTASIPSGGDHRECQWVNGPNDLRQYKLQVTIDGVSDIETPEAFQGARQAANALGSGLTIVNGIGQQAFLYYLSATVPLANLTVMTSQAVFEVVLSPPPEATLTKDQAADIVAAAAKAIAPEFS